MKKHQQSDVSFGAALRRAREDRGYTREQIAGRAGISPRFLAAIETENRKPSLDVLIRIVNAMGCTFDEVLQPQTVEDDIVGRIGRLAAQCSPRDQKLILSLIDKMLDYKETD